MNRTFYTVKQKQMGEVSTGGTIASVAGGFGLAAALEYFQVDGETMIILSIMLTLDYIFGVLDAYIEDKQQVTSTKMRRGLAKKLTRRALPLVVIAVLRGVGVGELKYVSTVIFSILIITEGYSIIGHFYSINSGKKLSEIDAFELLINYIISIFKGSLPSEAKQDDATKTKGKGKSKSQQKGKKTK